MIAIEESRVSLGLHSDSCPRTITCSARNLQNIEGVYLQDKPTGICTGRCCDLNNHIRLQARVDVEFDRAKEAI